MDMMGADYDDDDDVDPYEDDTEDEFDHGWQIYVSYRLSYVFLSSSLLIELRRISLLLHQGKEDRSSLKPVSNISCREVQSKNKFHFHSQLDYLWDDTSFLILS